MLEKLSANKNRMGVKINEEKAILRLKKKFNNIKQPTNRVFHAIEAFKSKLLRKNCKMKIYGTVVQLTLMLCNRNTQHYKEARKIP